MCPESIEQHRLYYCLLLPNLCFLNTDVDAEYTNLTPSSCHKHHSKLPSHIRVC